jgi:hypothetical protein
MAMKPEVVDVGWQVLGEVAIDSAGFGVGATLVMSLPPPSLRFALAARRR